MSIFQNLKVIELASVLAGPSVGQFFAELGAKVIKVENPITDGDVTRSWKLPSENKSSSMSAYFSAANWGKTSIALDITSPQDLKSLYCLIKEADIVLTSYKLGDALRLKVDYETLYNIKSNLIYGSITGYSTQNKAGYDAIIQAESGFMYMNGQKESPPTKIPVALMDVLAAHQLKEGILVALLNREKTGKGDFIEVSLFDSAISSLANQATNWLIANKNPQRIGSEHPNIVPYGTIFKSKDDKELVLAIGNDKQFKLLCDILSISEIAIDQRYSNNSQRVRNKKELISILKTEIQKIERSNILFQLNNLKIPAGPINSVKESLVTEEAQRLILTNNKAKGVRNIAFRIKGMSLCNLTPPPKFNLNTTIEDLLQS